MSSQAEDEALRKLLDRMVPNLKRAVLRDSERRPDALSLESSFFQAFCKSDGNGAIATASRGVLMS